MNIDFTAEQALLTCMLWDRDNVIDYTELTDDLFIHQSEVSLFRKLLKMRKDKICADLFLAMEKYGVTSEEIKLILAVRDRINTSVNADKYLDILKRKRAARELYKETKDITKIDFEKIEDIVNREKNQTNNISYLSTKDIMPEVIDEYQKRIDGQIKTFKLGYPILDSYLGRIREGHFIILGARTSMGKTSLLLNFAYRMAKAGNKVLFLSAEMTTIQLIDRICSQISKVKLSDINSGIADMKKLRGSWNDIYKKKLFFKESALFNMSEIENMINKSECDVLILDYIQRFHIPEGDNRAAAFGDIANNLKSISINKRICTIAGSQLNRQVEADKDKKVSLFHLKESGSLEEAADVVLLLELINDNAEEREVWCKIMKNRHGATEQIKLKFQKEYCNFVEALTGN